MIYEVRTYTLRAGATAEFEERYDKRLPARLKHSQLGAFWHTEFGPLNQVVHVYPYDDLQQRTRVRAALASDPERNALPGGQDLIVEQVTCWLQQRAASGETATRILVLAELAGEGSEAGCGPVICSADWRGRRTVV